MRMPQVSRPAVVQETSTSVESVIQSKGKRKQQQRSCKQVRKVRDQACVRVERENIPGRQCLIVLDNKAGRV